MSRDYIKHHTEGTMRELIAAKILMEQGYRISTPNFGACRYDIIAEKFPIFIRVQVKPLKPLSLSTETLQKWSVQAESNNKPYTNADCDVIMAINLESNNFAIVPIEKATGLFNISTHNTNTRRQYLNSFVGLEEVGGITV